MASSSPQSETCFNFITNMLIAFKDTILNLFFHQQIPEEEVDQLSQPLPQAIASSSSLQMNTGNQLSQPLPQAIASSSSLQMNTGKQLSQTIASSSSSSFSSPMKYQVFLSFRGGDTRLNFTSHLLKALKDTAMKVFFDEQEMERGEPLSSALSSAIAASNLSIIVLSKDYASSKSCLAEVSDIMGRKESQEHIVLPIFYHVNPSDVRNIGDSFKASFGFHESKGLPQVQQWKNAFTQVGQLKGWHIQGGLSDRSETEYIKDVVDYVIQKLNSKSKSISEELIGIDDQRNKIMGFIDQQDIRVIGLWGMGGSGKTTLAEAVYNEISRNFEARCFVQNVREKIEKQGKESVRDDLISKLLNSSTCIDTPSIGSSITRDRLNNTRVIVVLDDVDDSDQIVDMGIKHFGCGSKIMVTSRDKQELENGGADKIYKVEMLNKNDSFQLFSTFAFKQLNPPVEFRDLSYTFLEYAQGSPLALKVLGSTLYGKSRGVWESEVFKLKEYPKPKISQVLQRSYYGLDDLEKNIFLDIAILYKNKKRKDIDAILSSSYNGGAVSGISSLLDKCLLDIINNKDIDDDDDDEYISMHDMLEEMGKNIECNFEKRRRLWSPKDVIQLLKHKKWTDSVEGIKVIMHETDLLKWLCPTVFQNMHSLRSIQVSYNGYESQKTFAEVDIVSLPDELRYLDWKNYPFKFVSSCFNPSNLVVLRLRYSQQLEHLWNEDQQNLVHLRKIDLESCSKLEKIPTLSGVINLESINLSRCYELREIPTLSGAVNLKSINLHCCYELKEIPTLSGAVNLKSINLHCCYELKEIPTLSGAVNLKSIKLSFCKKLRKIPTLSGAINLKSIDLSYCHELREIPTLSGAIKLESIDLSHCYELREIPTLLGAVNLKSIHVSYCYELREIPTLSGAVNLKSINLSGCERLKFESLEIPRNLRELEVRKTQMEELSKLPPYLQNLDAKDCTSLKEVSFADQNLYPSDLLDKEVNYYTILMLFRNCFSLNKDSVDNIVANAMLKIGSLAEIWARKHVANAIKVFICCFPGDVIPEDKFEYHQSANSWLNLKIAPNRFGGIRFLGFAICLVVDFSLHSSTVFKCQCKLTISGGGGGGDDMFTCDWNLLLLLLNAMGDHVLILFSEKMFIKDKDYDEASFQFYFTDDEGKVSNYIKVKKCGVHVVYKDAKRDLDAAT